MTNPSAAPLERYLLPSTASSAADGTLTVSGVRLDDLARDFGTPLFVYDEQHLIDRCDEAVAAFPNGVAYASKAFLCKEMARLAASRGMKIDVASGGELAVALSAGVDPALIVMHGNNKSRVELEAAVGVGVGMIVLDSFDEIGLVEDVVRQLHAPPVDCLVRLTPGVEAHTHEFIMTGQNDSKFGFGVESGDAERAVRLALESAQINFVGVHAHIGSQIFDASSFQRGLYVLADFVKRYEMQELCVGGGLGVPYVAGETAPSITEWGAAIARARDEVNIPEAVRITAEPGRSIVAAAAITVYSVGTIKDIPGIRTYVAVDGGMGDNPRPVLYGSGYEAFLPRDPFAERERRVTIVGKHCESGDVLIRDAAVPSDLKVGDLIATPVTGGYGYSMASTYNKVPRPPVVFVRDGDARVVVRRETYDDMMRFDV